MPQPLPHITPRPAWLCLAALLCAFLGSNLAAQDDDPVATFEGMAEIKEVLLDVVALDRQGHTVLGLTAEDFEVSEDGEAVDLTGVSFYTTRYGDDETVFDPDDPASKHVVPSSRYFILCFHNPLGGGSVGNLYGREQAKLRRDSLEWVEDHLQPSDWVAVVSYDVRLKVYQDFTQDRFALAEGIRGAISRKNPEKAFARGGRPKPPLGAPSLLRQLPTGKALRKESRNFYDGLRLIAEAAGYTVGRKNLVLFSPGFGGFESVNLVSEPESRHYHPLQAALNDHNVAVYPIDLTPSEVRHFQSRTLTRLAIETGGTYFRDPISFVSPLRQVAAENIGYYLLSYQSRHSASESGYQEVKVRTKIKGVKLRARQGYRYGRE